jgi:hypothetical protein
MLNNPNSYLSKAEWCRYCTHLTNFNLSHFKVVEAMGLKVDASTSPAVASLPYKISSKSFNRFLSFTGDGGTHRCTHRDGQTGDLISLLSFLECRVKPNV